MGLGTEQRKFTLAIAKLILFAYEELKVELTFGDAYRDPRVHGHGKGYGSDNSVHLIRLAVDLNLFVGGEYITDSTCYAWDRLHNYWKSIGGADRISSDANHFSFRWENRR